MNKPRSWALIWGLAGVVPLALPISASAAPVDREHCIAAEIAMERGFKSMEGTQTIGADGAVYTRGAAVVKKTYVLTPQEEPAVLALADKMTLGATELVDLWLVGPGSVGRNKEKVLTEHADAFNTFYLSCLTKFRGDYTQ